jgi:SOS response regulatory protein OraA/RecX
VAPSITALRRARPGRVALELDGRPWRVVTDDVVVRVGLAVGTVLDRERLRMLRLELRRAEAFALAGRALARRDSSRARLAQRLARAGVGPAPSREALDTLERLGLVDDARVARSRALALAERGWGDAAIAAKLEAEGISGELAATALGELASEEARAARLAKEVDDPRRAAVVLTRRGFGSDAVEAAVGPLDELPPAGVP